MPKPRLAHKPQPAEAGSEGFGGVYKMGQAPLPGCRAAPSLGPGCAGGRIQAARFDLPPALVLLWFT